MSGYQGVPAAYAIRNGRLVTTLAGSPFEVTFYKAGDAYYAARSNEFGYANYQVLPKGPANLVKLNRGEHVEEDQSIYLQTKE